MNQLLRRQHCRDNYVTEMLGFAGPGRSLLDLGPTDALWAAIRPIVAGAPQRVAFPDPGLTAADVLTDWILELGVPRDTGDGLVALVLASVWCGGLLILGDDLPRLNDYVVVSDQDLVVVTRDLRAGVVANVEESWSVDDGVVCAIWGA